MCGTAFAQTRQIYNSVLDGRGVKRERNIAVKLAYDGSKFFGFQRQPEKSTVEGALIDALCAIGAVRSAEESSFRSSSRTDRGVSAVGNVVSFRTAFPLRSLCSAANSELRDAWVYAVAEVPDEFNPRWARQRWYRYHLPRQEQDVAAMREIASEFEGTHDFSHFCRKDHRNPVRKIDSIGISELGDMVVIDLRAESFLWNMVRRIVWVLDAASKGLVERAVASPEAGHRLARTGLAPAAGLVLMDVDCGVDFVVDGKAAQAVASTIRATLVEASVRREFSMRLLEAVCSAKDCEG